MKTLSRTHNATAGLRAPVLRRALPVGAAVAVYGLSYGVLAVTAGLSPLVATLSSVAILAGDAAHRNSLLALIEIPRFPGVRVGSGCDGQ